MTTTQTPQALKSDTIYTAFDRFVCSRTECAGYSARTTGVGIDGHRLHKLTQADIDEWPVAELGPITCECGHQTADHGKKPAENFLTALLKGVTPDDTDKIQQIVENLSNSDLKAVCDGTLRLNDGSTLDLVLWNLAVDEENAR